MLFERPDGHVWALGDVKDIRRESFSRAARFANQPCREGPESPEHAEETAEVRVRVRVRCSLRVGRFRD